MGKVPSHAEADEVRQLRPTNANGTRLVCFQKDTLHHDFAGFYASFRNEHNGRTSSASARLGTFPIWGKAPRAVPLSKMSALRFFFEIKSAPVA